MAGLLGRIEGWLELAVEGGTRAVFRQRLQPIELAKAAARAMQRQQLIGPDGIEVPNAFTVALHPDDLAEVEPYRASLEARISRYLNTFALERGWTPVAAISVEIVGDSMVRRRALRVDGRMADVEPPATRPVAPISATAPLPRIQRPAERVPVGGIVILCLEDGRQVGVPDGALRIGRALDNDLVIADSRVSRYHAQIARDGGGGVLARDLGSTNGSTLDGRPLTEDRLVDGDRLSLGGYIIDVRLAPAGAAPIHQGR